MGDPLQLRVEREEQVHRGSIRGLELRRPPLELEQIEVVAPGGDLLRPLQCPLRGRSQRQAGWESQRLLRPREEEIQFPCVEFNADPTDRGHPVHRDQDVFVLPNDGRQLRDRVQNSRGGLGVNHGDEIVRPGG